MPLSDYSIIDCMERSELFGPWFSDSSWARWKIVLKLLFGLPLAWSERSIAKHHLGYRPTREAYRELWLQVGRRGGKTSILALIAVYIACFKDFSQYLQPGEWATVIVISPGRDQAADVLNRIRELLRLPLLEQLIARDTDDVVELTNGVRIVVAAADYRTVRGQTIVCAILDELAFFGGDNTASPDEEILAALRPAMLTIPTALLLCSSTPYARRGAFWKAHQQYFGKKAAGVLYWKATTTEMNHTVTTAVVERALAEDPEKNRAEYLAEFRRDVEGFLTREQVEPCVDVGVQERPYRSNQAYYAFADPSGGSHDSFVLTIAHCENEKVIIDLIDVRRPPFNVELVGYEFCNILRRYHLSEVMGDAYAAQWVMQAFSKNGITYHAAAEPRSTLYRELLPIINTRRVLLLDNPTLINQLVALERRTGRGADIIDHARGAHDDVANACAGAVFLASRELRDTGVLGVIEDIKTWTLEKFNAAKKRFNELHDHAVSKKVEAASVVTVPTAEGQPCRCYPPLTSIVAGGQSRCAHCGKQWWANGKPLVYVAKRGDYLAEVGKRRG